VAGRSRGSSSRRAEVVTVADLLAVTTETRTRLLRDALGARAEQVEFADWASWYRSPTVALSLYGDYLKRQLNANAMWIRVVAEAAWTSGSSAELAAWNRYESLVNLMFASAPASIMCTYDERAFSRDLIAEAHITHPAVVHGTSSAASVAYRGPEDLLVATDSSERQVP
jgi:hypothetical protein